MESAQHTDIELQRARSSNALFDGHWRVRLNEDVSEQSASFLEHGASHKASPLREYWFVMFLIESLLSREMRCRGEREPRQFVEGIRAAIKSRMKGLRKEK